MQTTTFPAAEKFARSMPLPMTVDPVTRELYGYAAPVLDETAALRRVRQGLGDYAAVDAIDCAMDILRARAARMGA